MCVCVRGEEDILRVQLIKTNIVLSQEGWRRRIGGAVHRERLSSISCSAPVSEGSYLPPPDLMNMTGDVHSSDS